MKTLLEVLVQELKEWPKGAVVAVTGSTGNDLYFSKVDDLQSRTFGWASPGSNFMPQHFMKFPSIKNYHQREKVTKEQWENAQWKEGIDLPPVGAVCLSIMMGKVKVLAHTFIGNSLVAVIQNLNTETVSVAKASVLSKFKSEEEIQKDKHRKDLELILAEIKKLESQVARLEKLTGE